MQTADGSVWSIRTEGMSGCRRDFEVFYKAGIEKIQPVKYKKPCTFVLLNSDPCVHKEVRVKLSLGSGLK